MSKVCSITGSRVTRGSTIHRRGMAKKKGGVGRHVTKNVRREFHPNLHEHRIWVPELKKFVRIRVTARGLKTINKNGAYRTLKRPASSRVRASRKRREIRRDAIDASEIENSSCHSDGGEFCITKAASLFRPIWLSWLSCANSRRLSLAT